MTNYLSLLKPSPSITAFGVPETEKTHLIPPLSGEDLAPEPARRFSHLLPPRAKSSGLKLSMPRIHLPKRAHLKPRKKKPTRVIGEQVLPLPQRVVGDSRRAAEIVTLREPILLQLTLLSPFPGDTPEPLARSTVDVWSYKGHVRAEIFRLSGAEEHAFGLSIMARKEPVTIVLPLDFRGKLVIRSRPDSTDGTPHYPRVSCSPAVRKALRRGDVRFGGTANDGEDQIAVQTLGRVTLLMMEESGLPRERWFRQSGGWLWRSRVRARA
ncbi:hypothetical protein BV25DRAFT_1829464 [Artomyces pyxidatus]|uniref:Uncharacterized protein n=1 Tax=Artomyces pyxidatus TaxID=48021 RepID=A0ACB8SSD8_9AGAM|nr:hypothetical protein BV25DRAFT_1829464 [Artomyces pyxidatus]